jgi:hypothetical protein
MKKTHYLIRISMVFVSLCGAFAIQDDFVFSADIPVSAKSENSNGKATIEVLNSTGRYLDFRWINFDGNLELVRPNSTWGFCSIAPGNKWKQNTFTGHPFLIIDSLNAKIIGCLVINKKGDYKLNIQDSPTGFRLIKN